MRSWLAILIVTARLAEAAYDGFVISGQSNAKGAATHNQPYTGSDIMYKGTPLVSSPLADPVGDSSGSPWPLVSTSVDAAAGNDIMWIPAAINGVSITTWQPSASEQYFLLMTNAATRSLTNGGALKVNVFWLWETDAANGMNTNDFRNYLITYAEAVDTALHIPVMVCVPQDATAVDTTTKGEYRAVITNLFGTHNVIAGPDLSDMVTDDGYHLASDANVAIAASRWASNIIAQFYSPHVRSVIAGTGSGGSINGP